MAQAIFEVQTFDGHGWVTRHRGVDVDAAGEAARHVLPGAKKSAVRIVKQSYDPASQTLQHQVVFSLGRPRNRTRRRMFGFAGALAACGAAAVAVLMLPSFDPDALVASLLADPELVAEAGQSPEPTPEAPAAQTALAALTPAAGHSGAPVNGFDCEREAGNGLIRATNISPDRDRLYVLCARAIQGDVESQVTLATLLATGDGADADPQQAIRWLQEAARAGHAQAYRPLADLLMSAGSDPARAVAWYHRAATAGDIGTARMLAERYRTGDGVEVDARIALSYELMAAEAGDVDAMLQASAAFRTGSGTDVNADAAQRWLARAEAAGASPDSTDSALASADAPSIQWTSPSPAGGLIQAPALHLDIDADANETFSSFSDGLSGQASV